MQCIRDAIKHKISKQEEFNEFPGNTSLIVELISFLQIVFSTSNEPKILKTVIKTLPAHLTMKRSVGNGAKYKDVIIESQEK